MSSWMLVGFVITESQRELLFGFCFLFLVFFGVFFGFFFFVLMAHGSAPGQGWNPGHSSDNAES